MPANKANKNFCIYIKYNNKVGYILVSYEATQQVISFIWMLIILSMYELIMASIDFVDIV